jgi:TDG/mug DNA glycosylase family protein
MSRIHGFQPLVGECPQVLILGSMPSVTSLERHEYYGKAQNVFWRIMGELFGAGHDVPYEQRTSVLTAQGVAVWDVLASCVRPGSLDSAIEMNSVQVNDFTAFLNAHSAVRHIFFNGRKAEDLFRRRVMAELKDSRPDMHYYCLPSTSPAMASLSFAAKLEKWSIVSEVCTQSG